MIDGKMLGIHTQQIQSENCHQYTEPQPDSGFFVQEHAKHRNQHNVKRRNKSCFSYGRTLNSKLLERGRNTKNDPAKDPALPQQLFITRFCPTLSTASQRDERQQYHPAK